MMLMSLICSEILYKELPSCNASLLTNSQEESVTNISQSRLQHALWCQFLVDSSNPKLRSFGPLLGDLRHTVLGTNDGHDEDLLGTPLAKRLDGSDASTTGGNDGVNHNGKAAGVVVGRSGALGGNAVRKVVVVLNWVKSGGFTIDAKMVNWDALGKDSLHT